MKREQRYLIWKVKDLRGIDLSDAEIDAIASITQKVNAVRASRGKTEPFQCVVVEDDWDPEYEQVWGLIEAREQRFK